MADDPIKARRFVPQYVRNAAIKRLIKENGKQCSEEFMLSLDHFVQKKVREACAVHDGGAKRLTAGVAGFVGIR